MQETQAGTAEPGQPRLCIVTGTCTRVLGANTDQALVLCKPGRPRFQRAVEASRAVVERSRWDVDGDVPNR